MGYRIRNVVAVLAALAGLASLPCQAAWRIDGAASRLAFVSVKKGSIGEVHRFDRIEGTVSDEGAVTVAIDLASVNTAVPVRDERMRTLLFEVARFPRATLSGQVDLGQVRRLAPGTQTAQQVGLTLSLHGVERPVTLDLGVTRLADGGLLVATRQPVVIAAADFGLAGGIEALRKVVNLPSIATAVPVSVYLVLRAVE